MIRSGKKAKISRKSLAPKPASLSIETRPRLLASPSDEWDDIYSTEDEGGAVLPSLQSDSESSEEELACAPQGGHIETVPSRGDGAKVRLTRGGVKHGALGIQSFKPGTFRDFAGSVRDYLQTQYLAFTACVPGGPLLTFCQALLARIGDESEDYRDAFSEAVGTVRQKPNPTLQMLVAETQRLYGETETYAKVYEQFAGIGAPGHLAQNELSVVRYHARFMKLVQKMVALGDAVSPAQQMEAFKRGLNEALKRHLAGQKEYKTLGDLVKALEKFEARGGGRGPHAEEPRLAVTTSEGPLYSEVARSSLLLPEGLPSPTTVADEIEEKNVLQRVDGCDAD